MKKRIAALLVILTMIMSVLAVPAQAAYSIPSYVRIGLFYGANAKSKVNLSSDHGFYFGTYDNTTFSERAQFAAKEITVSFEGDSIIVREGETELYRTDDAKTGLAVFPTKGGMNRRLKIGTEEYRGGLDFKKVNGQNVIVNVVFMSSYLYGVISREMSPSWHVEALKAQAVCARNYAANSLGKHSEYGFDLCATVCCQAYSGTRFETENSYRPVDETENQVLTYDGDLAELYYSSSAGPRTEDVENVWGNKVPYLVSVDNSYEDTANIPNGVWTGSLTSDEASTIMRNKGYDVGVVTSIKATEYTENGRVLKLEVTGSHSTRTFEREAARMLFNTVTKSQMFTVKGNGEAAESVPTVKATDGNSTSSMKIDELVMLTGSGRSTLAADKLFVSNGVYQQEYEITETQQSGVNTVFTFEGQGWGHGIGMSQYGAKGMAESGYSYVDILLHYFPGTNLENAY